MQEVPEVMVVHVVHRRGGGRQMMKWTLVILSGVASALNSPWTLLLVALAAGAWALERR